MHQDTTAAAGERRRLRLSLSRIIDEQLAAEVEKESVCISPHVRRLTVTGAGQAVEVELDSIDDAAAAEVQGKVERFLGAMLQRVRRIEPRVYFSHTRRDDRPFTEDVYEGLRELGWLFEHGPGFVSLGGAARRLALGIDAALADRYRRRFGAVDSMFPAFIRADVLARCGYFESHPNTASMVTHIIDDFDQIESFRVANEGQRELQLPGAAMLATPEICLNPAACFPCYQALEGRRLDKGGRVLTWQGRVFRYESRNTRGLDRLAEFNVRELVFLGDDALISERRREAVELLGELITEWDLECRIETATDPFFATVGAARAFWQEARDVKYEIRLTVGTDPRGKPRTIAGGSFNLHESFFGERFSITAAEGEPAFTGCVGVGIERWVLAVFSQHGLDPDGWPPALGRMVSP